MKKLLSVSIAAYNVQEYLDQCLRSFVDKEILEKCEVIIVDDGSTDFGTERIAKKYEERYPECFIYVKKKNGGWGSTVNYAIKYATGKYFKQLDGDDYFDIHALKRLLIELETYDVDIVITPFNTFDDQTGEIKETTMLDTGLERKKIYNLDDLQGNCYYMHASTYKTDLLRSNNITLTENCFYTDCELVAKAINYAKTVVFVDEIVYQYRVSRVGQSVSIEGYLKHREDHEKVLKELLLFRKEKGVPKRRKYINCVLRNVIGSQYEIYLLAGEKQAFILFDQYIQKNEREIASKVGKKVVMLRMFNYVGFSWMAKYTRRRRNHA